MTNDNVARALAAGAGRRVTGWLGGITAVSIIIGCFVLGLIAGVFFNMPAATCGLWIAGLVLGPIVGMYVNYRLNKGLGRALGYNERRDNFNAVTGILGATLRKCPCGNAAQYDQQRQIWYCPRCGWWSK